MISIRYHSDIRGRAGGREGGALRGWRVAGGVALAGARAIGPVTARATVNVAVGAFVLSAIAAIVLTAAVPSPGSPQTPPDPAAWQTLHGATITARYQGTDSLRASRALALLESTPRLPGLSDPRPQLTLTIAPTRAVMDSLVGGRVPEWAGAVAISERMEMIIPGGRFWPRTPMEEVRVLRHEWAHLALAHEMGPLRIPRWFNEGYAEWASGGWAGGNGWKLRVALAFGDAPPLDSIALRWPRDRVPAEVAYLLSASVIQYLVESSGTRGLETFLAEWKRRRSFEAALRGVYGATLGQLETDWRKWVKRRYGWLTVLADSAVFWALLSVALVAMFVVRRRYRREQMARLRAGEPPDAPEYWRTGGEEPVDPGPPSR